MKILVKPLKDAGSCNYCEKAILQAGGMGVDYPYDKVVVVKGNQIETRFCEDCFEELTKFKQYL